MDNREIEVILNSIKEADKGENYNRGFNNEHEDFEISRYETVYNNFITL